MERPATAKQAGVRMQAAATDVRLVTTFVDTCNALTEAARRKLFSNQGLRLEKHVEKNENVALCCKWCTQVVRLLEFRLQPDLVTSADSPARETLAVHQFGRGWVRKTSPGQARP
jgi:hypothetical protein